MSINYTITALLTAIVILVSGCQPETDSESATPPKTNNNNMFSHPDKVSVTYTSTFRDTTVADDFFGTIVQDPYRWLEGDQAQYSTDIKDWIKRQNAVTNNYMSHIPIREAVKNRLTEVWNYERYGTPFKEGNYYYYFKNDGLQNQAIMYQASQIDGEAKVFLDPNTFSEDGTASLSGYWTSKKGKYMAYATSKSGSDWKTIQVKEAKTGKILQDKVDWVRYSGISWFGDGFFYSRYDNPETGNEYKTENIFHQLYYHKLGTTQNQDELIFTDRQNPKHNFNGSVTEDQRFLIIYVSKTTSGNALYYKPLNDPSGAVTRLIETFDADFWVVDNDKNKFLVLTNHNAPNYKLVEIDLNNPASKNWKTILPETEQTLVSVSTLGDRLAAKYIFHASHKIKIFERSGKFLTTLKLPMDLGVGQNMPVSISSLNSKKSSNEAFLMVSSFMLPGSVCKLDAKSLKTSVWKKPKVAFSPEDYTTEQLSYKSKDGETIRMFVTYKKGIKMDGSNPTLLYGYGGFNISIMPQFALERLPLLEKGGIYAVANIRGGGEYGEKWHKAGTQLQKQNVFDDFIAAAEHLIQKGYTSSEKLAIEGRSNGGLLIGACMTQRPELFRVALPIVGVMDMLRYHKFTIGRMWAADYGLSEDKAQFENLYNYSPVHNAKPAKYPATLVMTADHDDRVVPAHSFKFAAALQYANNGNRPTLIRIEENAGHGAGKPTSMKIATKADKLSFAMFNLGITAY